MEKQVIKHLEMEKRWNTEIVGCTVCVNKGHEEKCDEKLGSLFDQTFCNYERREDIPSPAEFHNQEYLDTGVN